MKKTAILITALLHTVFTLTAQSTQLTGYHADKPIDVMRVGKDGINYNLTMSDSVATLNGLCIPHLSLFGGPAIGLHSLVSLEDNNLCCGEDSLTAVIGILDNSGQFHHTLRMTQSDFYMRATEFTGPTGEFHISNAGISFVYRDNISISSRWLLSNKAGGPGQALMLNATGDTAQWKDVNSFASVSWFNPANNGNVALAIGSNIIEPANELTALTIRLPTKPLNGDIVALSFVKPVGIITYAGGVLANATTKALAGTTFKYIYYAKNNKWYNW